MEGYNVDTFSEVIMPSMHMTPPHLHSNCCSNSHYLYIDEILEYCTCIHYVLKSNLICLHSDFTDCLLGLLYSWCSGITWVEYQTWGENNCDWEDGGENGESYLSSDSQYWICAPWVSAWKVSTHHYTRQPNIPKSIKIFANDSVKYLLRHHWKYIHYGSYHTYNSTCMWGLVRSFSINPVHLKIAIFHFHYAFPLSSENIQVINTP